MNIIDIRSDTVTKPTPAMRKAMAEAEVGDDVYGDDPTINKLEKLGAKMLGKEASVFVPSGTFGNQLALFTWAPRGTEVILGEEAHIVQHEAGAASVIAGVQTRTIPAPDGILTRKALEERLRHRELHFPATSLICLENAHSLGQVVSLKAMDEARAVAKEWKLPIHLDGARIFNAAAALGCEAKDIAARADSVMFCLSKGLCAPVGSLLAGSKAFVEEARMKRKIMGGGMRQAGILAAAGILALTEQVNHLAEDHARAKKMAKDLAKIPGIIIKPKEVEINMVFFAWPAAEKEKTAKKIVDIFAGHGIIINAPEHGVFRFVTHYWIGDSEAQAILAASREAFRSEAAAS
ncbi:low-specificity L-threonine aldolase [Leadbettera azotonutricia]|uniref:Low-specificity L-threonine aldolase n=1 Tax=Leadbettera azotonutricia (strain ATCC BAA-888 / DSM 13862 / ZAS-9) TaxID=545695 RepID=F5YDC6_LEAAZ|nr:low-specificity L-threonine aldolase [Leadbettera azotonutricia]AEF82145.1 low-specificity L-threonine aldolase [Leadbettera azotonutricia ZAS-9]